MSIVIVKKNPLQMAETGLFPEEAFVMGMILVAVLG